MGSIFSLLGFFIHLFFSLPWFIQIAAVLGILFLGGKETRSARRGIEGARAHRYYGKVKPQVERLDRERRFSQIMAAHEEVNSRWNRKIKRERDPAKQKSLQESRDKELRLTDHLVRSRKINPGTGEPGGGIRREGKH
jgi:hypothetical protein